MGRIEEKFINVTYMNRERKLRIYIPEKYDKEKTARFPVLYMHDGQNMYFDEDAAYGCSWRAKDTLEQFEASGKLDGIILVAIDNDGVRRLDEYSPWKNTAEILRDGRTSFGEDGDKYADFLVNELKPFIDKEYRTLPEKEDTAIAGSSMGAYISLYVATKYKKIFSKIGLFSPAIWFNESDMMEHLDCVKSLKKQKYFIHTGTQEGFNSQTNENNRVDNQKYIDGAIKIHNKLMEKEVTYNNLKLVMGADEYHFEKFWAKHFATFIEFMFC